MVVWRKRETWEANMAGGAIEVEKIWPEIVTWEKSEFLKAEFYQALPIPLLPFLCLFLTWELTSVWPLKHLWNVDCWTGTTQRGTWTRRRRGWKKDWTTPAQAFITNWSSPSPSLPSPSLVSSWRWEPCEVYYPTLENDAFDLSATKALEKDKF